MRRVTTFWSNRATVGGKLAGGSRLPVTEAMIPFEPLVRLFRGDQEKVRRILGIFERTTRNDLAQLDQAYSDGSRVAMGQLAHKMKSSCRQIGEMAAADALTALERVLVQDDAEGGLAGIFPLLRDELDRMLDRVGAYLATAGTTPE